MNSRKGFTLVELLVVLGIIVVLISMLLPVVASARYRARLVTCASNLRQVGQGIIMYANEHKGCYPPRPITYAGLKANQILIAGSDLRVPLQGYIDWNQISCPFAPRPLDYANKTGYATIEWTYNLWCGWQYQAGNEQGAFKAGQPFTYQGKSFNVLASDFQFDSSSGGGSQSEHPTTGMDIMDFTTFPSIYFTRWNNTTMVRGPVDLNFLMNDGSVSTIYQIGLNYWTPGNTYRSDIVSVNAFNFAQPWLVPLPTPAQ